MLRLMWMAVDGVRVCLLCAAVLVACGSTGQRGSSNPAGSAGSGGLDTSGSAGHSGGAAQGGASAAQGGGNAGFDDGGAAAPGGTSNGGSSTAGAAGAKGGCTGPLEEVNNGLCVAKMVAVDGGFSIDATEVTRGQYQSWLATSPALDSTCTPKPSVSYDADAQCTAGLKDVSDDPEHLPQVCVDWCDAAAYCKGVGKRLCGKIGGGPTPYALYADATASQWQSACSSGGLNVYPYGNTHDPAACNGYDNPNPGSDFLPVGSLPMCQSSVDGYQGVFDLSGNVHEWEDSCQGAGNESVCRVRGGSVVSALECAANGVGFMTNPGQSNFGIRCCKD